MKTRAKQETVLIFLSVFLIQALLTVLILELNGIENPSFYLAGILPWLISGLFLSYVFTSEKLLEELLCIYDKNPFRVCIFVIALISPLAAIFVSILLIFDLVDAVFGHIEDFIGEFIKRIGRIGQ